MRKRESVRRKKAKAEASTETLESVGVGWGVGGRQQRWWRAAEYVLCLFLVVVFLCSGVLGRF